MSFLMNELNHRTARDTSRLHSTKNGSLVFIFVCFGLSAFRSTFMHAPFVTLSYRFNCRRLPLKLCFLLTRDEWKKLLFLHAKRFCVSASVNVWAYVCVCVSWFAFDAWCFKTSQNNKGMKNVRLFLCLLVRHSFQFLFSSLRVHTPLIFVSYFLLFASMQIHFFVEASHLFINGQREE